MAPFQSVWGESHEDPLSKIGPLLRKELREAREARQQEVILGPDEEASETNLIKVIVVMDTDHLEPLPESLVDELEERVEALGGHIGDHAYNNVQAWIALDKREELAEWSEIRAIRKPIKPTINSITSQGVGIIGAPDWHSSGLTGRGVKVGVLDVGFQGYSSLLGTELPASTTLKVFGSESGPHGTACAEIVHDVAPEAELFLAAFYDVDVDFHNAVSWLVSQKVDVITSSVAMNLLFVCSIYYEMLRYDADYAENQLSNLIRVMEQVDNRASSAVSQGITWSQAAGNWAYMKWRQHFNDPDHDYWLNFTPQEEHNQILNVGYGREVYVLLKWGYDAEGTTRVPCYDDYDLQVVDESGRLVASSSIRQGSYPIPIEACKFTTAYGKKYFVRVAQMQATPQRILLLLGVDGMAGFNHYDSDQTVLLTPPGFNPDVITVGAVPYYEPDSIEWYSSRGPAHRGAIKPDLVAPVDVYTASYGGWGFAGTSAAAPHVGGVCALVKQAYPGWSPRQIKSYLESNAIDLGPPGKDNTFGSGLVSLSSDSGGNGGGDSGGNGGSGGGGGGGG
jgi:hypothetical protein